MKKKILVLTIAGLLSLSAVSYASENLDNIAKSKACVEQARASYVNAEQKLNEAIRLNNKNDEAYFDLGRLFLARKDYKKAINYFSKAISINPQENVYYAHRGSAEVFTNDFRLAINDFNKAIEINPKNQVGYFGLATLYRQFGYFKEALGCYNKVEECPDGTNEELYFARSEIKVYLKDYTGAIEDLKKAKTIAKKKNDQKLIVSLNEKIKEIQAGMKVFK